MVLIFYLRSGHSRGGRRGRAPPRGRAPAAGASSGLEPPWASPSAVDGPPRAEHARALFWAEQRRPARESSAARASPCRGRAPPWTGRRWRASRRGPSQPHAESSRRSQWKNGGLLRPPDFSGRSQPASHANIPSGANPTQLAFHPNSRRNRSNPTQLAPTPNQTHGRRSVAS